jgi:hypothetical protein
VFGLMCLSRTWGVPLLLLLHTISQPCGGKKDEDVLPC